MKHSFIWTSNAVENCPECLHCGIEVVDGSLRTINTMAGRDEYLMGEFKLGESFPVESITKDWFKAEVRTEGNNTSLFVTVADPASVSELADSDYMSSSNLQILDDGTHKYLEMKVQNTVLDQSRYSYMFTR